MKITNDDFTSHVCDDPSKDGDGLGWSLETDMTTEGKDELIHNQKLRELIEKRRRVAHDMWNADEIRKDGVNPSQREFVLDMELEKLLHEVDKK